MIQTSNYLSLSPELRLSRVSMLQSMRALLRKDSMRKKVAKTKKARRRKPVFFSDVVERMFNDASDEVKNLILKGG